MAPKKRKAAASLQAPPAPKKAKINVPTSAFNPDLFKSASVKKVADDYKGSGPYPHAVVKDLITDDLLRNVRKEILGISFELKETDIYRIKQSGDLASLDKLSAEELSQFPSVHVLRNALYSSQFRDWVSQVTGAGKLSGSKTDMAVNIYEPGCYLLCHDDFIGTRKVSYILYLTDPDDPWNEEWGGGLRLYSTQPQKNKDGKDVKVPLAYHDKSIPPSSAQLSFFAVLPGESYHDVEEVYFGENEKDNKRRERIAVSGWFHLPQEGEDGFDEAANKAQEDASKAARLESEAGGYELPQTIFRHFDQPRRVANSQGTGTELDPGDEDDIDQKILTEQDLTFLIKYITPGFLVPDKMDQLSREFLKTSKFELDQFFSKKFAKQLRDYISKFEKPKSDTMDVDKSQETEETQEEPVEDVDSPETWQTAVPPNKHRYTYLQKDKDMTTKITDSTSPISKILVDLIHSHAFKKWLALATQLKPSGLTKQNALARRFRKGLDYALGSHYKEQQPRLEFTISMTPSAGWVREESPPPPPSTNGHSKKKKRKSKLTQNEGSSTNGGEEVYIADDIPEAGDTEGKDSSVGKKDTDDPAVYQASRIEGEDDILLDIPPKWNVFNVVLRDANTIRCVNYVSKSAKGDRWDIKGEIQLSDEAFGEEEEIEKEEDEEADNSDAMDGLHVDDGNKKSESDSDGDEDGSEDEDEDENDEDEDGDGDGEDDEGDPDGDGDFDEKAGSDDEQDLED